MKITPLLVIIISLLNSLLPAFATTLRFVVNHPGSPPYLYFDEQQDNYQGIIPDLLNDIEKSSDLNFLYISNSRKRSEEAIYQGHGDLTLLSKSWLTSPEQLITTLPIHQHRSFLYSNQPFAENFELSTITAQHKICTRTGFKYPNLTTLIDEGLLLRVDSYSHLSMLRMLIANRCNFVIFNEFNAITLLKQPEFENAQVFRSVQPVIEVPLHIVMRPELIEIKAIIDQHILSLKNTGQLDALINKHIAQLKDTE